jgi:hypothetical protein
MFNLRNKLAKLLEINVLTAINTKVTEFWGVTLWGRLKRSLGTTFLICSKMEAEVSYDVFVCVYHTMCLYIPKPKPS